MEVFVSVCMCVCYVCLCYVDCTAQMPLATVSITGNQTVLEGTNVTFSCTVVETSNGDTMQLRSNWFILFPDTQSSIRFQGGIYSPAETDRSLFHVPDTFPGIQENFTFISISREFNMVEVQCFNGGFANSSFITFYGKLLIRLYECTYFYLLVQLLLLCVSNIAVYF